MSGGFFREFFALRSEAPAWAIAGYGALCVLLAYGIWVGLTWGEIPEERILGPTVLPTPGETFGKFGQLWFDMELTRNTFASLKRVCLGFGLAILTGVPLGILCGCFTRIHAFFLPVNIFGRNIPIAALIPLTFSLFGIGELQKIMFIYIACVAFIISDTAGAIRGVAGSYVDTAYTLGANRRQVILKVLFPIALPEILNSIRLLFGLAFGYIMLAELVKAGDEAGGLGDIISISQRKAMPEPVLLVLMIIPIVALGIDRCLYWVQRELFPYRYGGHGWLRNAVRAGFQAWDDLKGLLGRRRGSP